MDQKTREDYIKLAEFLHSVLGSEYEIVLHDLEDKENSIAYLANGHISGRTKEDHSSDTTYRFIEDRTAAENDYVVSHKGVPKNNQIIRSSSFFIKDGDNNLTGILCINFNGSHYVNLAKSILKLTHMENASIETETLDSTDFKDPGENRISLSADHLMEDVLDLPDVPVERLTHSEKINIVRELNHKGVFLLKGAVSEVAAKLGVSEATLYRYIRTVTKDE